MFQNNDPYFKKVLNDLLKQKEDIILGQLGELVTSNLIEVQEKAPVLIHDDISNKLVLKQAIKLHFKGYERIVELEKENELLKSELKNILNVKERLTNE